MSERGIFQTHASDTFPTEVLDLRVFRASRVFQEFTLRNREDLSRLGQLDATQAANLANELALSVFQSLNLEKQDQSLPDQVNPEKVEQLTQVVQGDGTRLVVIRHAEQSPPEFIYSIPRTDLRKIRMMQNPFNQQDLITNKSFAESYATSLIIAYVAQRTGKEVRIYSSENMRALEIAKLISQMTQGAIAVDEGLSCITYKDEHDNPSVTLEQILAEIPSGFMPWNPELVDKLCKPTKSGGKPSEAIIRSLQNLFNQKSDDSNVLIVALTHSQQMAEALSLAGLLTDHTVRLSELSMVALGGVQDHIFERGILREAKQKTKRKDIRRILEKLGEGYQWYKVRRKEFETKEKIPFLVSAEPLAVKREEAAEILRIGKDVAAFMNVCQDLFTQNTDVASLLTRGKPDYLTTPINPSYFFVRPDLIIGENGFTVCEIETSLFGLSLAELLNRTYISANFDTLVPDGTLKRFLQENTSSKGKVVYSQNTSSYQGQLEYLAKELLSSPQREWQAQHIDDVVGTVPESICRGFYLCEATDNLFVHDFVTRASKSSQFVPSLTPHMEEKALLALLWDKRYESFFAEKLGRNSLDHLRTVIPPTWIVGNEQYFAGALPDGVSSTFDLTKLSKAKRRYVLKRSGFSHGSSWAEGVNFLQEKSQSEAARLIGLATKDNSSLYVVQEFREGKKIPMEYLDKSLNPVPVDARVRITPYFSMAENSTGQLLAIKATGCENTNYVHASTESINTAVSVIS